MKYGICWGYSIIDITIPKPRKKKYLFALNIGILKYIPNKINIFPSDVVIRQRIIAKNKTTLLFNLILDYYY